MVTRPGWGRVNHWSEATKSYSVITVLLLSLLLGACQPMSKIASPTERLQTAEVPASGNAVDRPLEANDESFELNPTALTETTSSEDKKAYPQATAALWAGGFLWTANESGLLTRWDVKAGTYKQYRLPGNPVICALASDGRIIYAGTEGGDIWRLADDGSQTQMVSGKVGRVSALAFDGQHNLWYVDASHFDQVNSQYGAGRGLVFLDAGGKEKVYNLPDDENVKSEPLKNITALIFDREAATLWAGTHFAGLLRYDVHEDSWQSYNILNSDLGDNTVNDLKRASDGSLWLATASGISIYSNSEWKNLPLTRDLPDKGALSLAIAGDNTVWVAGESYIAQVNPGETWQVYSEIDNPLLSGRSRFVVLDDEDRPWLIGRRGKIHFDGEAWIAIDADVRRFAEFTPVEPQAIVTPPAIDFPPPTHDYVRWLKTWPRPEDDNGRGMHFLQTHQFDAIEAQRQVNRMQRLGVHWALVHYASHDQLVRTAPIFQEAGITVVWRPFVRPYGTYDGWAEDVQFLRTRGLAPYIQLYNEPSLAQEWEDAQSVDQETYWRNLLPAVRQVYEAGGYIGLQFVNPDWLRLTLQRMKAQGMSDVFDRLFFVPHLYGLNHPPEYAEDVNSVLGFREFARVFEEEIGFVPVMIAGEGGWRPGEAQDNRYPAINEELHRNYHLVVFDWFRIGQLSNGEALPDYFFAFCPWLISDPDDPAAWFDSTSGDRILTIKAVEAIPPFKREFSWDK
jgi:sugar lactone lactonase YvrE